ncbi:murein L,D-transpeptidase catalytic domain family protein [Altererythrobacter sp. KTW20L]|uniref:murein L,D-transpeptidase catalytic domain-containing protein n=1 Tax=Altererythrobacter sp. KTW20L TaxID=2942210 RepID=UPI0020C189F7|nr:murein L,D-transpeptidase catalytic domain family protein [Altererythrobacter sp. KTW20L]MCL6251411.1 murein L,D-transpeptidase catalytic domain family protein [Altererythrobacter sp. KTW20L]
MDRRTFLTTSAIGAAALASPLRVAAQPGPDGKTRRILEVARAEIARAGNALWRRDMAAIADFGVHSAIPRFHIANMEAGTVRSLLVAHGSGSDPEHDGWLNDFSNLHDSWATSRGAYVSWEWYEGRFGTSMRLEGLDPTCDQAYPRAIVMHAAAYATPAHVARWGRAGRSNGCFAVGPEELSGALYQLSGGRLLFADRLGIGEDGSDVTMPPQAAIDFAAVVAQRQAEMMQEDAETGIPPLGEELP